MPAPSDIVYQQSTTSGTGNLTLAAVNGRRTFAGAFGTGATTNVFDYYITASSGSAFDEWERGTGHMSNSTTLVRDTVIASSNANSIVNFSGGILDVTNDIPAANQVRNEGSTVTDGDIVVMDGTTGRKIKGAGVGRKGPTVQTFSSSGTWTKPTGCVKIKVTVIGAGGAGGNAPATSGTTCSCAGGGGPGGWATKYIDVTSISSATITIGAANGGTSSYSDGTNSFSATGGGTGSTAGPSNGSGVGSGQGATGVGSGGDINGAGWLGPLGLLSASAGASTSGSGGSSLLGGGPGGQLTLTKRNGATATVRGCGGEGSANGFSQTAATGGSGADGYCEVEEYYA